VGRRDEKHRISASRFQSPESQSGAGPLRGHLDDAVGEEDGPVLEGIGAVRQRHRDRAVRVLRGGGTGAARRVGIVLGEGKGEG